MKRFLKFENKDGNYVINEEEEELFVIDGKTLEFNSRMFYEKIYSGEKKTTNIELRNKVNEDELKKGNYIFEWLTAIFKAIKEAFNEEDEESVDREIESETKVITLYEMSACAGDGFYFGDSEVNGEELTVNNMEADYAVKISGRSMEPEIADGSIALVKLCDTLAHNEIGIFIIDGDVMCKRYLVEDEQVVLVPDNNSEEYKKIFIDENVNCVIQGKVIEIIRRI